MESVDVVIDLGVKSDQGPSSNVDVVMGPVEETHRNLIQMNIAINHRWPQEQTIIITLVYPLLFENVTKEFSQYSCLQKAFIKRTMWSFIVHWSYSLFAQCHSKSRQLIITHGSHTRWHEDYSRDTVFQPKIYKNNNNIYKLLINNTIIILYYIRYTTQTRVSYSVKNHPAKMVCILLL